MNSNSKLILVSSFSLIIFIQITLTLLAVSAISDGLDTVNEINKGNETAKHIFNMRDAAHNRALLLYRMIEEEDAFDREEMRIRFYDYAETFIKSRENINSSLLSPKLKNQFLNSLDSASVGQKVQTHAIDFIFQDDHNKAGKLLKEEVIPAQDEFISRFTSLLDNVKSRVRENIVTLTNKSKENIILITLLGVSAVFLGTIIAIYVFRRITKSERDFVQQKEIAERSSIAKTMFLANMSHEIRSPLTAIIGFSESLNNRNLSHEQQVDATKSIERNSKHLYQVINDILDITKIESGQLTIEMIETSLIELLEEISSIYQPLILEKNLAFNLDYQLPLPQKICTDPVRLKQILINLISNALKFTNEGSINITVTYSATHKNIQFSVIDTGIGMTAETSARIFSAFTQADTSTTREFGGTGLGLNISKQLTEKLGGKLECSSTPGEGSCFRFDIPIGRIETLSLIQRKEQLIQTERTKEANNISLSGNVLVAEDTFDNQKLIEMYINETGAVATIVENGQLAVNACQNNKYDLILMDMQMPVMDGVTAMTNIRKFDKSTPIISLTANALQSDVEKCESAGANDFMTKPIDPHNFNQILKKYLQNSGKKATGNMKAKSERLQKIIDRFVSDLPDRYLKIQNQFNENNWQALQEEAHKLKGLGTSMGFPLITEICEKISNDCLNKHYDPIEDQVNLLGKEINRIRNV